MGFFVLRVGGLHPICDCSFSSISRPDFGPDQAEEYDWFRRLFPVSPGGLKGAEAERANILGSPNRPTASSSRVKRFLLGILSGSESEGFVALFWEWRTRCTLRSDAGSFVAC